MLDQILTHIESSGFAPEMGGAKPSPTTSSFLYFTILPFHHFSISPFRQFSSSSFHRFTISSFLQFHHFVIFPNIFQNFQTHPNDFKLIVGPSNSPQTVTRCFWDDSGSILELSKNVNFRPNFDQISTVVTIKSASLIPNRVQNDRLIYYLKP